MKDGWRIEERIDLVLSHLVLSARLPSTRCGRAGGAVLLARPGGSADLLLLDELTNYLDWTPSTADNSWRIDTGAVVFITHDRAFLQRLATRIVEIDRAT